MGELTGMGGGYEMQCREMLLAGLDWLDAHPDADPQFRGYKHIYGVLECDNADAKALSAAVCAGFDDITGAMHQCVCSAVVWIKHHGWEKFCEAKMQAEKRPLR
jgi:hypothetical protein